MIWGATKTPNCESNIAKYNVQNFLKFKSIKLNFFKFVGIMNDILRNISIQIMNYNTSNIIYDDKFYGDQIIISHIIKKIINIFKLNIFSLKLIMNNWK